MTAREIELLGASTGWAGRSRCLTGRQRGATMAGMRWTREPWGESGGRGNGGAMVIVAIAALAVIAAAILEAS